MVIKIRKATKKDFDEYFKLRKEEFSEMKIDSPSRNPLRKEFEDFLSKKSIIFVIEDKQGLHGFISGKIYTGLWKPKFHIWYLFVEKEYRRKGLGIKLLKEAVKFAKSKKVKNIALDVNPTNKKALKLYKKAGFEINKYRMKLK